MAEAYAKPPRACVRIAVSVAAALLVAGSTVAPASSADTRLYVFGAVDAL